MHTKAIPILNLKAQYSQLALEIEEACLEVLRSGHYILGPKVKIFEQEAREYLQSNYAIGCANGSDALYLALLALDIKAEDEVITTPFTYIASAEAISQIGAKPVFVDIDLDTYNLDPDKLEEKINSKTKAIILVHLYGQCCEMDKIIAIAQKYNLKIIEDSAQAFGAKFKNQYAGTLGDIGTYSFYPTKNLSCAGDGGMLSTNNSYLAERLMKIRVHGSSQRYYHDELGVNSRLDEIQAAILSIKLKHLDSWNQRRQEIANFYTKNLSNLEFKNFELVYPIAKEYNFHIYHQYTLRILGHDTKMLRNHLREKLLAKGIATEIYYPLALHEQKLYANLNYLPEDLPNAHLAAESIFCLPIYPELEDRDLDYIIEAFKEF